MDLSKELLKLAHSGKANELSDFLVNNKTKLKINTRSRDLATPIIQAVQGARKHDRKEDTDFVHVCRLLVSYGAHINLQDHVGRTGLHWAVFYRHTILIETLLDLGADPSLVDEEGNNCLLFAIRVGTLDAVRIICDKVVDWENSLLGPNGLPPLIYAVQQGKVDIVEALLGSDCDINVTEGSKHKKTALHLSIQQNNLELFQLLLKYGAKADIKDGRGKTVLVRASAHVDSSYLQELLKKDTDMSAETIDQPGITPLMLACQSENINNVTSLIQNGADLLARNKGGKTALHYCIENTTTECASVLLDNNSSVLNVQDSDGYSCLHLAVIAGNKPLLALLLDHGANINSTDNEKHTAVHWATVCGHLEILDILINQNAVLSTPDIHEAYPLHYAAQIAGMNTDGIDMEVGKQILQRLLTKGIPVDVNDRDKRQPLLWAASAGSSEACIELIKAGAKVGTADKDGLTALHCAASRGHPECVQTLVEYNAVIDCKDRNGCSPLFYANTLNHVDCAKLLLDLGADKSLQDKKGRSPAHCAAAKGSIACIQLLKEKNSDLWIRNHRGEFPLHECTQSGYTDVAKFLIKEAVDQEKRSLLDAGNLDGRTCIHLAAMSNHLELIKLLLDNDANVNSVMKSKSKNEYFTPYDVAVLKGNVECADYLKSHGATTGKRMTDKAVRKIQKNVRFVSKKQSKKTENNKMEVLSPTEPVAQPTDHFESNVEEHDLNTNNDIDNDCRDKNVEQNQSIEIESSQVLVTPDIIDETFDANSSQRDEIFCDKVNKKKSSDKNKNDVDSPVVKGEEDDIDEKSILNANVKDIDSNADKTAAKSEVKQDDTVKPTTDETKCNIENANVVTDDCSGTEYNVSDDNKTPSTTDDKGDADGAGDNFNESEVKQIEYSNRVGTDAIKGEISDSPSPDDKQNYGNTYDNIEAVTGSEHIDNNENNIREPSEGNEEIEESGAKRKSIEGDGPKSNEQSHKNSSKKCDRRPIQSSSGSRKANSEVELNDRPKTSLKHSDDGSMKSPRSQTKSAIARSVQDSVRNFQYTRLIVKELHRIRKAQIHQNRKHDVVIIRNFIEQYKREGRGSNDPHINSMDDWEKYLREQLRFLTYLQKDKPALKDINPIAKDEQRRFEREANESREKQQDENYRRSKKLKEQQNESKKHHEKADTELYELAKRTDKLLDSANHNADKLLDEFQTPNNGLEKNATRKSTTPSQRKQPLHRQKLSTTSENLIKAYKPHIPSGVFEDTFKFSAATSAKSKSSYGRRDHSSSFPLINGNSKRAQSSKASAVPERKMSPAQYKVQSHSYPRGLSNSENGHGSPESGRHSSARHSDSNYTPRYDGNLRLRNGLVFQTPEQYREKMKYENENRYNRAFSWRATDQHVY